MPTNTAVAIPPLHVARDRDTEMLRLREHLELLMTTIQRREQEKRDLIAVCEKQQDEIDRLRKLVRN